MVTSEEWDWGLQGEGWADDFYFDTSYSCSRFYYGAIYFYNNVTTKNSPESPSILSNMSFLKVILI